VILKCVLLAKLVVSCTGMRHGVIADLVSLRCGATPAIQTLFNLVPLKEKRDLNTMLAEQRQARIDLAGSPVVEAQAERHAFSIWPLKGARSEERRVGKEGRARGSPDE